MYVCKKYRFILDLSVTCNISLIGDLFCMFENMLLRKHVSLNPCLLCVLIHDIL